jgi:serine/threonine protein kinase
MGDHTESLKGGSVIGAGGYGCVLRPPINCKNDEKTTQLGLVSKIMRKKNAKKEFSISTKFEKILSVIPNYKDYFIFPEKICKPDKLKDEDKINFTLKCNTLLRKKFTVDNINKKLDSLKIIQMQDGGMDLDVFLRTSKINMNIFGKMNASLEKLLANAILPMNAMNVYHLDLKASNMMIDDQYNVKIVDWGLSTVITDFSVIPREFRRPLHFNMPYSVIILNKDFLKFIDNTLQITPNITVETLIPKLSQFYIEFAETYGAGHEERINDILHNLTSARLHRHNEIIMRYIAEIIVEFREADNTFNVTKYFKEVFLRNVDIWGYFHAYFPIMNLDTPRKVSYSKKAENFISDRFKELYTLFLLKYSTKAIPVLEFRDWVIRIQRTSEGQISNVKTFSFELESIIPLAGSKDLNLKMVDKVDKVNKNKVSKKRNRKRRKRSGANDMSKTRKK